MSKITINAVLTVLRLVISLVSKSIRLIYSIVDLVDDGCINSSVARPDWVLTLSAAINTLESQLSHLGSVEDDVYNSLNDGK